MNFDPSVAETVREVLRWRRDVRHFRNDPVSDAIVERLERAMDLAPSVGNARPWRVIRVEDHHVRAEVRAIFCACNGEAAASYHGARGVQYRGLKLAGLDKAPLQLAVFTDCDPAAGHGLGRHTIPETLQQSTAMAVHTLWLAARAENLGLGMVSIVDPERLERLFRVPDSWRFAAYLCLGWPEFDDDRPLLHRVGWQRDAPTRWTCR
jgi:5,6-dimethylbenzimidazole synthase